MPCNFFSIQNSLKHVLVLSNSDFGSLKKNVYSLVLKAFFMNKNGFISSQVIFNIYFYFSLYLIQFLIFFPDSLLSTDPTFGHYEPTNYFSLHLKATMELLALLYLSLACIHAICICC